MVSLTNNGFNPLIKGKEGKKMKKIGFFLTAVVFLLVFLINITSGISQEKMLWSSGEISLLAEGFRVKSFGDKTVEEPLFIIKIGDTTLAETEMAFWGGDFR